MKRPDQTHYQTPQKQLAKSKEIIEEHIDSNRFSISADKITNSDELRGWLKEWGWKLEFYGSDPRERADSYYKLIAI